MIEKLQSETANIIKVVNEIFKVKPQIEELEIFVE